MSKITAKLSWLMMNLFLLRCLLLLWAGLLTAFSVSAQNKGKQTAATPAPSAAPAGDYENRVGKMQKFPGFLPFYFEEKTGKIWLEISQPGQELLYVTSLPAGMGSNDVGLDRGKLGSTKIVKFVRAGHKLLLTEPNYRYRANTSNPDEKRAVEEAFASSVLWGFEIAAEEPGRLLIDLTPFLMQDANDIAGALRSTRQGNYRLDASRSAVYLPSTKNFPKNTEIECISTFTGEQPGGYVRSVTPTAESITLRQRHSFIELPDSDYQPRAYDPRAGYYPLGWMDYATPISAPIMQRVILRHRLKKQDPTAPLSPPVEPIVYYLDRGTPEPIRTALLEGGRWWNQAFEAAGYQDAFRVELMPEGADPMDVRYNVIQWVHRSTRGWSYGASVVDPRTGEIIKGHVSLGSLRVRQDFLIAAGLLGPYKKGQALSGEMEKMSLARLRQLSAHEIGHTLGLFHNFAASVSGRASVMDYPHPLVLTDADGNIDLSQAYAEGIGEWDKFAIAYGYQDFPPGANETEELNKLIGGYISKGIGFIADTDSRAPGGAHPHAHLWDNGADAAQELERVLQIRKTALQQFSADHIAEGQPVATAEEALVPIYLFHRYQTEAAVKLVGGANYSFAVKGDGQPLYQPLDKASQLAGLEAILKTLQPSVLDVPAHIRPLLLPRPPGYPRSRETFASRTGVTPDHLSAAESAAEMAISLLLHPHRAERLHIQHAQQPTLPSLSYVLDRLFQETALRNEKDPWIRQLSEMTAGLTIRHTLKLAHSADLSDPTRATVWHKIGEWKNQLKRLQPDPQRGPFATYALQLIEQAASRTDAIPAPAAPAIPDGAPIGSFEIGCTLDH